MSHPGSPIGCIYGTPLESTRRPLGIALLAAVTFAVPTAAQENVADGTPRVGLSGYVRTLSAGYDAGFDVPVGDRHSAFHGDVVRLRWALLHDGWVLEFHNRFQTRVTSAAASDGGAVVGLGVSATPDRSLDLSTRIARGEHVQAEHDIDRLSLTVYSEGADLTLGRQAITWGISTLFPVADLWSRFSPYELDTDEKPGVDAIRALIYPSTNVELDAVLADKGSMADLSFGLRASWTGSSGDVYLAAGKLWREAIVLAGASRLLSAVVLRGEGALAFEPDGGGVAAPRITVGVEWFQAELVLAGEIHFNGIGNRRVDEYAAVASDPRFARGETYFLGRYLAGALAAYSVTDRLGLALSTLVNLTDPSASVSPSLRYDLGQNARLAFGGLLSLGPTPIVHDPGPVELASEFGSYGRLLWTEFSLFF